LTVFEIKVCKQCLQTASVSGGHRAKTLYQSFAPGPHWGTSVFPTRLAMAPTKWKTCRCRWPEKASNAAGLAGYSGRVSHGL